ncbi:MAG: CatB-related O-acetyltransferase [Kangiella sp.]|nr:CatB-related O-acetyltransferase [Kangiella sp.]
MWYKRKRYGLSSVANTFFMSGKSIISKDFKAGEYSFVAEDCRIGPKVIIGNYVMFGPKVSIVGGDHEFTIPGVPIIFSGRPELGQTIIEDDVWIGFGAVIMAGVTIGRGAVIAASSVVTKDVPPYSICAGIPARVLKFRFGEDEREIHDEMLAGKIFRGKFCDKKE